MAILAGCSRGPTPAEQLPPPPFTYLGEWGKPGDGPGELKEPAGIAVDGVGNVFISDRGSRFIHKFDSEGKPLLSFQGDGLKNPAGIAVDSGGAIYVADPVRGSVFIFLPDGTRLREIRGGAGGPLRHPESLAVAPSGSIYVLEGLKLRIRKFNPRGRSLKMWGKTGTERGEFLAPDGLAAGLDGSVYVSDGGNRRIQKFTNEGEFVAGWGIGGAALDAGKLSCVAVTADYVFAIAPDWHSVDLWALDGRELYFSDLAGRLPQDQGKTLCLAVSPRAELLVLDPAGAKVLRFHIDYDALKHWIPIWKKPLE